MLATGLRNQTPARTIGGGSRLHSRYPIPHSLAIARIAQNERPSRSPRLDRHPMQSSDLVGQRRRLFGPRSGRSGNLTRGSSINHRMTSLSPATHSANAPSNRYEIRAGSRLHLGLVEIHPGTNSCYGGIGWMVTDPYSTLRFEIAECRIDELQVVAPNEWKGRVLELCHRWLAVHPSRSNLPVRSLCLATTHARIKVWVPVRSGVAW